MPDLVERLYRDALTLIPDDRARLVEMLSDSLEPAEPGVDRLWVEEAERRLDTYLAVAIKPLTREEFLGEVEASWRHATWRKFTSDWARRNR